MAVKKGRWSRRRSERGAAVFMVVLLITLLTGIGLFAVRSAVLSTSSSGHARQMSQTHYITEYATTVTAAELSTERRDAYVKLMAQSPDCPATSPDCKCKGIGGGGMLSTLGYLPTNGVSNRTCYIFGYADSEPQVAGANLLVATVPGTPGSLGHGQIAGDWRVEMSDLGPASPPVAGTDLTSAGAAQVQYMAVTMSVTGEVHPTPAGDVAATGINKVSSSVEQGRAHLIVGPLPKL